VKKDQPQQGATSRPPRAVTVRYMAEDSQTSQPFWRNAIRKGELETIRLGRAVRVPLTAYEAYLENRRSQAAK
jgi:excisionase family DNA binding protein